MRVQPVGMRAGQLNELSEGGAAVGALVEIGAQAHERILQLAGVHLILVLIVQNGFQKLSR